MDSHMVSSDNSSKFLEAGSCYTRRLSWLNIVPIIIGMQRITTFKCSIAVLNGWLRYKQYLRFTGVRINQPTKQPILLLSAREGQPYTERKARTHASLTADPETQVAWLLGTAPCSMD